MIVRNIALKDGMKISPKGALGPKESGVSKRSLC